ncbi:hypothetical protein [Neptunicella sp. SCSIO 80796]|uniref:hypothetical protein n=1 Tax=Neptunicella plasticusilytica TaxID=3117012 RepID=UPI003A4E50B3
MPNTYTDRDKYGKYSIEIENRILMVTVSGALGKGLTNKYTQNLYAAVEQLEDKPWAYLANALQFEALTNDGLNYLTESFQYCMQHNCVADAYCMTSSLAINQADRIRRQFGAKDDIQQRLFSEVNSAKVFLNQYLEQLKK